MHLSNTVTPLEWTLPNLCIAMTHVASLSKRLANVGTISKLASKVFCLYLQESVPIQERNKFANNWNTFQDRWKANLDLL